jgi:hypothetical protein
MSCRTCGAEVLEVRTSSGFDVVLDPEPLTPVDELRALVAGCRTYTRHLNGDVHPRTAHKIRAAPAGSTPRSTVHRTHEHPPPPAGGAPSREGGAPRSERKVTA